MGEQKLGMSDDDAKYAKSISIGNYWSASGIQTAKVIIPSQLVTLVLNPKVLSFRQISRAVS